MGYDGLRADNLSMALTGRQTLSAVAGNVALIAGGYAGIRLWLLPHLRATPGHRPAAALLLAVLAAGPLLMLLASKQARRNGLTWLLLTADVLAVEYLTVGLPVIGGVHTSLAHGTGSFPDQTRTLTVGVLIGGALILFGRAMAGSRAGKAMAARRAQARDARREERLRLAREGQTG